MDGGGLMRWEDERYVRIYTRDTADWVALGWEAQALFMLALRKMDRAGILDLGKAGVRGLAGLVLMPVEVVERALPVLLDDGCFVLNGKLLVCPNYIAAQETPQSDAQRKRESRSRAADLASAVVTKRDGQSRNVTAPDASAGGPSELVTPYRTVPIRTVPEEEAPSPAERQVSRLENRDEALTAKYPLTSDLMARLDFRGEWPKERATRDEVEASLAGQDLDTVAARVSQSYAANGRRWLGWHLDAIRAPVPARPAQGPWARPALPKSPEEMEREYLESDGRKQAIAAGELKP